MTIPQPSGSCGLARNRAAFLRPQGAFRARTLFGFLRVVSRFRFRQLLSWRLRRSAGRFCAAPWARWAVPRRAVEHASPSRGATNPKAAALSCWGDVQLLRHILSCGEHGAGSSATPHHPCQGLHNFKMTLPEIGLTPRIMVRWRVHGSAPGSRHAAQERTGRGRGDSPQLSPGSRAATRPPVPPNPTYPT